MEICVLFLEEKLQYWKDVSFADRYNRLPRSVCLSCPLGKAGYKAMSESWEHRAPMVANSKLGCRSGPWAFGRTTVSVVRPPYIFCSWAHHGPSLASLWALSKKTGDSRHAFLNFRVFLPFWEYLALRSLETYVPFAENEPLAFWWDRTVALLW